MNIKYRDSLDRLGCNELSAMLFSLGINSPVSVKKLGGASFIFFESRPLSESELLYLSAHSAVVFMGEYINGLLKPIDIQSIDYLPEDLPEILKYKGKTGTTFTKLMINVALSYSVFAHENVAGLTVMDPVCGKATTPFCALQRGMNACGVDIDTGDLKEASDYFSRYLKYHTLKHTEKHLSETVGKTPVPSTVFTFANTKEAWQAGDTRTFTLYQADTALCDKLSRKNKVHLIVGDLPYGIQHAPVAGKKPESFMSLLNRTLPSWYQSLLPGGAIALSFNTLTLPSDRVSEALEHAGFIVCSDPVSKGFRHEVEQAVVRDVVFAVKPTVLNTPKEVPHS